MARTRITIDCCLAKAELDNLPRAPLILICDQSTIDCVRVEKDCIQDIIDHSGISRLTLQRISQQSQVGDTILPKPKWMGTASALVFSSLVFRGKPMTGLGAYSIDMLQIAAQAAAKHGSANSHQSRTKCMAMLLLCYH